MDVNNGRTVMIDGSRIVIEALAQSGAQVYIGYPITPANWLYDYANQRFPAFLAAPDEISALQWAAGFSATGKLPVTATSFPGFALMLETFNMLFMMELPAVIILSQRLGPATGSATTGAQGDLLLLRGAISGGYPFPVFCPASFEDCWHLAGQAAQAAVKLRTPVVLLTSKEMMMTRRSFDLAKLPELPAVQYAPYQDNGEYLPYRAGSDRVPPFVPVGSGNAQVRLNASTHDSSGLIRKDTPEALGNSIRLRDKMDYHLGEFSFYDYNPAGEVGILLVSYGITADAAREAVQRLRASGTAVSLLILKTLLPLPPPLRDIMQRYKTVLFAEENLNGALRQICFGEYHSQQVKGINKIGRMIAPAEIIREVEACKQLS